MNKIQCGCYALVRASNEHVKVTHKISAGKGEMPIFHCNDNKNYPASALKRFERVEVEDYISLMG